MNTNFAHRHAKLLHLVNVRGILTVAELARILDASLMTIRRDLSLLDAKGLLRRIRGGATALSVSRDLPLQRRERLELQAKGAIGHLAANFVQPGETVLLDAGTTVFAMAKALRAIPNLTIVTNSLQVLSELWSRPGLRMVSLGGVVRRTSGSLAGSLALKSLGEIRVDRAFLGTIGVTAQWEVSNSDLDLAALQRHILSVARESYLLADHTKFGRSGLAVVAPIKVFTAVITDERMTPKVRGQLQRQCRRVLFAKSA
jgi:DeoR/GlpR family transcriptional regulator of sugar metabolism